MTAVTSYQFIKLNQGLEALQRSRGRMTAVTEAGGIVGPVLQNASKEPRSDDRGDARGGRREVHRRQRFKGAAVG